MKIENVIRERRSIRKYKDKVLKEKEIEKILTSATWAPSGLNNQPWKFKVLEGDKKDTLAKFTKYGKIIKSAPLAVCVFLDNSVSYNREKDILAVGACIQNMLLQAYEKGIASCWLGEILNRRTEVQEYLGTDEDHELMAVVTLGYPEEGITKGCRKNLKSFLM